VPAEQEVDEDASAAAWTVHALLADEAELGVLVVGDDPERAVLRAEALVVAGAASEALRVLARAEVGQPAPDGPLLWGHLVLAAAHAATGSDQAWAWLTARLAGDVGSFRARLTRIAAAAADARGDREVADQLWPEVVGLIGVLPSPRLAERIALASVLARNRDGRPEELARDLGSAVRVIRRSLAGEGDPVAAMVRTAGGLDARGDMAGARLLLRTAVTAMPRDRRMTTALRHRRPKGTASTALKIGALTLVVAALVAVLVRMHLGGGGLLIGLALVFGSRVIPHPGLTAAESRLWRGLGSLQFDPELGDTGEETSGSHGWYGVVAIGGAVAGAVLGAQVPGWFSTAGQAPAWSTSGGALLAWLGLSLIAGALAFFGARRVHRTLLRRSAERDSAGAQAVGEHHAGVCQCWDITSLWGTAAGIYAERHLVQMPGPALPVPVGGQLRRCPTTGLPWLVGPLGRDGRRLALRGVARAAEPAVAGQAEAAPTATSEPPSVGYYL